MQTIQVGKLKHDLASVLEMVKGGQEFIIEFGRKHQPIAVIVPYAQYENATPRTFELLENKGSFKLKDDFEMSDEALVGL